MIKRNKVFERLCGDIEKGLERCSLNRGDKACGDCNFYVKGRKMEDCIVHLLAEYLLTNNWGYLPEYESEVTKNIERINEKLTSIESIINN